MKKVSVNLSNDFCPQPLYLYGTYREDGKPNFGLFCWFSYCWDGDLSVMACIGGEKLTKDRIKATNVFSANLVTEQLLPLADYFGNKDGYDADKMPADIAVTHGEKLNVPVLVDSPRSYELRVKQWVKLDGSEIMICKIENIVSDDALTDASKSIEERMRVACPAVTTARTYFSVGNRLGAWADWKNR